MPGGGRALAGYWFDTRLNRGQNSTTVKVSLLIVDAHNRRGQAIHALIRGAAAVLVCLAALTAPVKAEQTLQVTPLARDGHVLVSFKLGDVFTEDARAAVHSGLTISFVYKVDLMRSSPMWIDRTIASAVVTATVRYDNLTRRYHVTRVLDGRIEWADTTDREDVAREWLTTNFDKLPLFGATALERNSEYYVRVRAHTTPRNASFLWPWDRHEVMGLAKFTFVQ
jgi:hypothetical protein